MIPPITNPADLRERGFSALVKSLGWVNAVRFMQQLVAGQGDYTRERDNYLPNWDAKALI